MNRVTILCRSTGPKRAMTWERKSKSGNKGELPGNKFQGSTMKNTLRLRTCEKGFLPSSTWASHWEAGTKNHIFSSFSRCVKKKRSFTEMEKEQMGFESKEIFPIKVIISTQLLVWPLTAESVFFLTYRRLEINFARDISDGLYVYKIRG